MGMGSRWRRVVASLREHAAESGLVGWLTIPLLLGGIALIAGGFWLGEDTGTSPAAVSVVTLVGKSRVVTVRGVTTVRVPARTIKVKGRRIRIPAQTLTLHSPPRTLVEAVDRTSTVNHTVRSTVTRTGTTTIVTTITGPTTTETSTATATVTTTVTVTTT